MKVLFITGGSRGIGKAIVERFGADGFKVAACATSAKSLERSQAGLRLTCDVSDAQQVRNAIAEVVSKLGRLDILICNAGIAGENPMGADDSDDIWHRILSVNLNGTYYACKQALPYLPDGSGRIINIGSVLSYKGTPDQSAYAASKHAVLGFTRSLSYIAAKRKITVNAICPTWVKTDMAESRWKELGINEKDAASGIPIRRVIMPEEVAGLAAYLASEAASGITGQGFVIDGGSLA